MLKEFKEFALKGNVLDMAVGIIIGAAFSTIVSSLVADIIMPLIGIITGGHDFAGLSVTVGSAVIAYGSFVQAVIDFVLVALSLFFVVKSMNKIRSLTEKKQEPAPEEPAAPTETELLAEIRDLLKKES